MAALAVLLVPTAAGASATQGLLEATAPVMMTGSLGSIGTEGVAHFRGEDVPGLSLSAARLEISWIGQEGYETVETWGAQHRVIMESREATKEFGNATLSMVKLQPDPEALAIVRPSSGQIQASGDGLVAQESVTDKMVTKVRWIKNATQATGWARFASFWYMVDGPWVMQRNLDQVRVVGDFRLFLNNVTLVVESDGNRWSHWTGHRVDDPGAPVSRYETRVTVINVVAGELALGAPDELSVYAPSLETQVVGRVESERADGELLGPELLYRFESSRLRMDGAGTLSLAAHRTGGTAGGGVANQASGSALSVQAAGSFDVEVGPGVEAVQRSSGSVPFPGWVPWSLGALAVVGVAMAVWRSEPVQFRRDRRLTAGRGGRLEKWVVLAAGLVDEGEGERALQWTRRAMRRYPRRAEPWYYHGDALYALGRYDDALEAYRAARERLSQPDEDILVKEARAALRADRLGDVVDLAAILADIDPEAFEQFISEVDHEDLSSHPGVERIRTELGRQGAGSTAYA